MQKVALCRQSLGFLLLSWLAVCTGAHASFPAIRSSRTEPCFVGPFCPVASQYFRNTNQFRERKFEQRTNTPHTPLVSLKSMQSSSSADETLPPAEFSGRIFHADGGGFHRDQANEFLRHYWQKSPCLIRKAFDFKSPLSADELAGLACEEDVMSRVIVHWDAIAEESKPEGKQAWELMSGPFKEEFFSTLPETCYTLLVQEVNKHVPEISALLDRFRFVPNWRLDDVMISYAATGGGVGPHTDSYDVFLLQGKGKRRWAVSYTPIMPEEEEIVPDINVRVLEGGFVKDEEWVLEEGDLLYVPPRIPHWGVAEDDDCMTYSIGFRAPNIQEVTSEFAVTLSEEMDPDAFYEDPERQVEGRGPGLIAEENIDLVWGKVKEALLGASEEEGRAAFARWFGGYVTEPLRGGVNDPLREIDEEEARAIAADLLSGAEPALYQAPGVRFAWLRLSSSVAISVNGELYEVKPEGTGSSPDESAINLCEEGAAVITGSSRIAAEAIAPFLAPGSALAGTILELIRKGYLNCPADDATEDEQVPPED